MKILFTIGLCFCINTALFAQDPQAQLKSVGLQLSSGQTNVTAVLTDQRYMKFHSLTEFRDLIKRNANQEKISVCAKDEPGIPVTVTGRITDGSNIAVGNVLVYVYHTDNKGWYSDTAGHVSGNGDDRGHARLFGYFKTNNDGSFTFNTIQPQGYPNSNLPQHIHFEVFNTNGEALMITELLFSEDPRLNNTMKQRMINEGAVVASNKGSRDKPVYSYEIHLNK